MGPQFFMNGLQIFMGLQTFMNFWQTSMNYGMQILMGSHFCELWTANINRSATIMI